MLSVIYLDIGKKKKKKKREKVFGIDIILITIPISNSIICIPASKRMSNLDPFVYVQPTFLG